MGGRYVGFLYRFTPECEVVNTIPNSELDEGTYKVAFLERHTLISASPRRTIGKIDP